ncbi:fibroblast growth factor receptor homolog 1-like [Pleurodeles waltl]|uniref:fibroblast growth factor receptor homolog 1-like n=1 Tax=Pleurodeles waltl TaxID=8319 RepID=UPI0037099F70
MTRATGLEASLSKWHPQCTRSKTLKKPFDKKLKKASQKMTEGLKCSRLSEVLCDIWNWTGMAHRSSTTNRTTRAITTAAVSHTARKDTRTSATAATKVVGEHFSDLSLQWLFFLLPLGMIISILITLTLWKRCSQQAQSSQWMQDRRLQEQDTEVQSQTKMETLVLPKHENPSRLQPLSEMRSSMRNWRRNRSLQSHLHIVQDMTMLEMIKDGKHGRFYRARLNHGSCKGHKLVTCKVFREGVSTHRLESEALILRKVGYHKHILQLLDCNTSLEPYMLILENVSHGTLKHFVHANRSQLINSENLQTQLTIAAYHLALAMEHIASRMVLHRDLALRNIVVSSFPYECKLTEFGLARDLSNNQSTSKDLKFEVPLRWYPPEYFRDRTYYFPSEVWSFGILLWELETLGCSPYPELESPEEVVLFVCSGQMMTKPNGCREDIFKIMEQCWADRPCERPTFGAIAKSLEGMVGEDADYLQLEKYVAWTRRQSLQPCPDAAKPRVNKCVMWDMQNSVEAEVGTVESEDSPPAQSCHSVPVN